MTASASPRVSPLPLLCRFKSVFSPVALSSLALSRLLLQVGFVRCYNKSRVMSKKGKGAAAEGPPPLLGRIGTSLKVGIVGLPNVGYVINNKNNKC